MSRQIANPMSIEQHLIEMRSNQAAWHRRPLLRKVYGRFYGLIREALSPLPGPIVELGSGIGAVKEFIPSCVTTDIFSNPWLDRKEDAYALSFADSAVSNLILLDVFHHLNYPGTALKEFHRVLRSKGRVIILEPAMSLFGKIIYGLFHHEALGLRKTITWFAPEPFNLEEVGYYAAQGNASRVFLSSEYKGALSQWDIPIIQSLPDIAYVASGGFSKPQLYPSSCLPALRMIERVLAFAPSLFATRLLVVLEKKFDE